MRATMGLTAMLDIDRLNRRFFPTDGWALRMTVTDNQGDGGTTRAPASTCATPGRWAAG
jgi:hypothetical protein